MKKRRVVPKRAELLKRLKEGERKKIKSSALLQKFEQLVKWLAYQQYGREVLTEQEMLKVCRRAAKILLEKPFVPRETKLDALKGSRFIYVAGLDSLNKRCFKKFPYRWKSFLRTGLRVEIHTIIGSPLYGPLLRGSVARVKVVPDREKWLKVPEIANALRYRRIRDYSSHVKDSIGYVACKFHKVSNNNYALVIWNIQHRGQSLPRWFASRCKNWKLI